MKEFLLLLVTFIASISGAGAQSIATSDSLEITSRIADWNNGWKIRDYRITTKWYGPTAEFTNAFGHHRTGHIEIEKLINEVFQLPFVMAGDSKVLNQKFVPVTDDVVLVITSIERAGQKTPDNKDLAPRITTHHRVFKRENGWWIVGHLISDARDTQSNKH